MLASLLALGLAGAARADPGRKLRYTPVCDDGAPTRCTQPLLLGELAPFDGQLLTTAKAIQLGELASGCEERSALAAARTSSVAAIEVAHARELGRIDTQAAERERDLYRGLYEEAKAEEHWYEAPVVVVPATIVVTLGVVWLATRVVAASAP